MELSTSLEVYDQIPKPLWKRLRMYYSTKEDATEVFELCRKYQRKQKTVQRGRAGLAQ